MSKEKKTIEELLEEKLIPFEEQTHIVPENWVWTTVKNVCQINMGQSPKGEYTTDNPDYVPLIGGPADMGLTYPKAKRYTTKPTKLSKEGDMIVSIRATLGKTNFADGEYCLGRGVAGLTPEYIDPNLLGYYFATIKSYLYTISTGTTFQQVSRKDIENTPLPLPPLNEQKRIAEKVERLLDKIDDAKQLIEEAKETFELRRAAILDKAFRGGLTEGWRRENPNTPLATEFLEHIKKTHTPKSTKLNKVVEDLEIPYDLPKGWVWARINDLAELKSGYAFKSKDFVENGYQLVRMGNLYKNELDLSRNPVYLPIDYDEKIVNKYSLANGVILLSLTGTKYKRDYGFAVRMQNIKAPLLLNQRILALTPFEISDYFYYFLQSSTFRNMFFSFETGGVNQGNVGSKSVEGIYFPLPPKEEAVEIQLIIENMLEQEKKAFDLIQVEQRIESIKQSILTKAFKGELGTNNPNEESAIELLQEALQEQVK
jgi:type I restriction enzyme, S subunit